jgi:hypothetical protein
MVKFNNPIIKMRILSKGLHLIKVDEIVKKWLLNNENLKIDALYDGSILSYCLVNLTNNFLFNLCIQSKVLSECLELG